MAAGTTLIGFSPLSTVDDVPDGLASYLATVARADIPATLSPSIFTPPRERLEGCLRQRDFRNVSISRHNSHSEFVAVPVMGCTVAVNV